MNLKLLLLLLSLFAFEGKATCSTQDLSNSISIDTKKTEKFLLRTFSSSIATKKIETDIETVLSFVRSLKLETMPAMLSSEEANLSFLEGYTYNNCNAGYQRALVRLTYNGALQDCLYQLNLLIEDYGLEYITNLLTDYNKDLDLLYTYCTQKKEVQNDWSSWFANILKKAPAHEEEALDLSVSILKDLRVIFEIMNEKLYRYVLLNRLYRNYVIQECQIKILPILQKLFDCAHRNVRLIAKHKNYRRFNNPLKIRHFGTFSFDTGFCQTSTVEYYGNAISALND
ncbi:MAG: hypothetical protein EBU90_23735 [Proteobacteria bacterium]|nr:hypothetical protein [Pseudomonadota bacterium]NBP14795.1 hypothetical protein [bacterium]